MLAKASRRCSSVSEANQFIAVEEHMLRAAQTDTFGTEVKRVFCIGGLVGICADTESFDCVSVGIGPQRSVAHFIAPAEESVQTVGDFRIDKGKLAFVYAA